MSRRDSPHDSLCALIVVAACSLAAGPVGATDCPTSFVTYDDHSLVGGSVTTSAVAFDTTFFSQWWVGGYARITFDRNLATLSLTASTANRFLASVRVTEQFDITGVPVGTPVSGTLVYRLNGWSEAPCAGGGCGLWFSGAVVYGADSISANANQSGPVDYHKDVNATLTLPVTLVSGMPLEATFTLFYNAAPGGGGTAQAVGTYGIGGLPPGVHAIACPGADVTPVRRSTWGGLKTTYR